jgi:uncharacterized protein YyaL (SSP411 family)
MNPDRRSLLAAFSALALGAGAATAADIQPWNAAAFEAAQAAGKPILIDIYADW